MAAAFFNELAGGKDRALSAGTDPTGGVNPTVDAVMSELGIDISPSRPRALTAQMLGEADIVVTMGCGAEGACPATSARIEDWDLEDPAGKSADEVRAIRDEIRERVSALIRTEFQ